LGNKTKISTTIIASALLILAPFLSDKEGNELEAYQDVVGVYTICGGVTLGVTKGMKLTEAECEALTSATTKEFLEQVAQKITAPVSPDTLAAHTSFAYNIGVGGYSRSKTLRLTNAGDLAGGCRAMGNWFLAGGKDCRIRENNCYGVINRRNAEIELCLGGL